MLPLKREVVFKIQLLIFKKNKETIDDTRMILMLKDMKSCH